MNGLLLEGGGARGAYQVGAIKALVKCGRRYGAVAGVSIGAINAAFFAQGGWRYLFKLWNGISIDDIIEITPEERETIEYGGAAALFTLIERIFREKGIETRKLHEFLIRSINEKKLRKKKIEIGLSAFSWKEHHNIRKYLSDLEEGTLIEYLLATSALPFFKTVKINDQPFLDGGFTDFLPVEMLMEKGCDSIDVIRIMGTKHRKIKSSVPIHYIVPRASLGVPYDFTQERIQRNIQLGYFDALKALKKYRGNSYCIDNSTSGVDVLASLPYRRLSKTLYLLTRNHQTFDKQETVARVLKVFRILFPMPIGKSDEDVLDDFLEVVSEGLKLKKFRIYTYKSLLRTIQRRMAISDIPESENIRIFPGVLISPRKKEIFLLKVASTLLSEGLP